MKIIVSLLLALMMSVSLLTACAGTSQDEVTFAPQTEAPTEVITEAPTEAVTEMPTEAPTEAPTEEPTAEPTLVEYDSNEVSKFVSFLEIKDENGIRNGEKLSENYNPNNPETWGDGFIWKSFYNEFNKLTKYIAYIDISDHDLVGVLDVFGCKYLSSLYCNNNRLTQVLTDSGSLSMIDVSNNQLETLELPSRMLWDVNFSGNENLNEVEVATQNNTFRFVEGYYLKKLNLRITDEYSVFRANLLIGEPWGTMAEVNLEAEGNGYVCFSAVYDDDYTLMNIIAVPEEGAEFIGWYDSEGNLVSDKLKHVINNGRGDCVGIFNYIAKFE